MAININTYVNSFISVKNWGYDVWVKIKKGRNVGKFGKQ
jgi:hypothetical protein